MRTLCVAVVVLSLSSAAAGPLTCDKLLKPAEKRLDVSGIWYIIAKSTNKCLTPGLFNELPSISLNITAQAKANIYEASMKIKINKYCATDPLPFIVFENNTISPVDSNDTLTSVLPHSGCPDCLVFQKNDTDTSLLLISRGKNVTAAELKEFETQGDCLALCKPVILNTDHDYENCSYRGQ